MVSSSGTSAVSSGSHDECRTWIRRGVFRCSSIGNSNLGREPSRGLALARSLDGQANGHTKVGIDVLEEQNFAPLRGKRVGLITNHTGVDSARRRTIDVLAHADAVKLVALFSPEHGIAGRMDSSVANATDEATGLPIFSLFGETRRPNPEMLANLDALVYDIQDAGVRFYTYVTTMGYCMEEAAKRHISFYLLDRPDPIGGEVIEGPVLDRDKISFVAYFPMPVRFAMTLGELAQMFNAENHIGVDLHIIGMQNWRRSETYDETGLAWVAGRVSLPRHRDSASRRRFCWARNGYSV
jgi:uncharacterized protein YbbC (DUF1343 family)